MLSRSGDTATGTLGPPASAPATMKNSPGFAAVADAMAKLDFCMMQTMDGDGVASRPMSNNGEVRYDGDTWFFARTTSAKVDQIGRDPSVQLAFSDTEAPSFISVWGTAEVLTDVELKKKLWHAELERWFENGPEDPDVCLIRVAARRIQTWGRIGDCVLDAEG